MVLRLLVWVSVRVLGAGRVEQQRLLLAERRGGNFRGKKNFIGFSFLTPMQRLVSHYTDTHFYILSLALALLL